jgi:hypothetical protein
LFGISIAERRNGAVEKWILLVRSNCVSLVDGYEFTPDDKFNDWYDNVHVPDVLKTPGFISARRFVNPDISTVESGKYVAMYEIETEDIRKTLGALQNNLHDLRKRDRLSNLLQVVSATAYKRIS